MGETFVTYMGEHNDAEPEWFDEVQQGIHALLMSADVSDNIRPDHIADTPIRVARFYRDFLWGYGCTPAEVLATTSGGVGFQEARYDQMIVVHSIDFVSLCAHHLLPFMGKAHFGYLPDKRVVGLSKMARLIDMFSHRLQLQENLTQQIVDAFQEEVSPRGCGLVMEAEHTCMSIRGVEKAGSVTVTNALTGLFLSESGTKEEFFSSIRRQR